MNENTTSVTTEAAKNVMARKAPTNLKEMISDDRFHQSISDALPPGFNVAKFVSHCKTAVIKVPQLSECTISSITKCLLDCASLGLYPDGRLAHLIPYKDQCTLILDYKGIIELVTRSGEVKSIHADVVCVNDIFDHNMGIVTKHTFDLRKPRGDVYAAYCLAMKSDGSPHCQIMSRDEIEKVRQGSRGRNSTPWVNHWNEMAKKTVFRRLSKWLPMCTDDINSKMLDLDKDEFTKSRASIEMPGDQ